MSDNRTPSPRSATAYDRLGHPTDPSDQIRHQRPRHRPRPRPPDPPAAAPGLADGLGRVRVPGADPATGSRCTTPCSGVGTLARPIGRRCLSRVHGARHGHECPRPDQRLVVAAGLVSPATAAAGAPGAGCGPVFWGYGAMAGQLHGDRRRWARSCSASPTVPGATRRPWHPYAAAVVLAFGHGLPAGHRHVLAAGLRRDPLAAPLEAGDPGRGHLHGAEPRLAAA